MKMRLGSSLVEVLIAIVILTLMLFALMSVILLTSQNAVATKEVQSAYLFTLSELEKLEASQVSNDLTDTTSAALGSYSLARTVTTQAVAGTLRKAGIDVEASWSGARNTHNIRLERQVSPSAWQNAGQIP